jgi:hypothetical protein
MRPSRGARPCVRPPQSPEIPLGKEYRPIARPLKIPLDRAFSENVLTFNVRLVLAVGNSLRYDGNFRFLLFPVGRHSIATHSIATHSIANLPLPARLDWHPIGRPSGVMAEEWVAKE